MSVPTVASLLAACGGDDETPAPAAEATPTAGAAAEATPTAGAAAEATPTAGAAAEATPTAAAAGEVTEGATVVLAQGVDATYLDPQIDLSGAQLNIHDHTHDALTQFSEELEIVPVLAESWEIPDPETYIFTLKQGVKFHDGTELTANDVKFSLERCYLWPETMTTVNFCEWEKHVKEAIVVDDHTIQIDMNRSDATFLSRIGRLYIVPEDAVRNMGPDAYNQSPVGTGAFKVVEWVKDQRVVLEANPDYFAGAPHIGELIVRPISEESTRVAALRNGEVDISVNVSPDSIALLEGADGVDVQISDSGRLIFFYMNTYQAPFDNVQVRRAMNHAVDWDLIIQTILGGQGYRTPGPITPYDFPFAALQDVIEERAYEYDPDRAMQLLAEAGYPDGFDLELEGPDGRYLQDRDVLEAVGGFLDGIGIRTTVRPQEWGIYYQERFFAGQVQCGLFGMGNPIHDVDHLMAVHFDPDRRSIYYTTPELKELIDAGLSTPYPEERIEIYRDAMTIIMEDAPWIFAYAQMNVFGVRDRVAWTPPDGDEFVRLHSVRVSD